MIKNKFHLTLVVLISLVVTNIVTSRSNMAMAVAVNNQQVYNHIYNINKENKSNKSNIIKLDIDKNSLNNRNVYLISRSIKRASRSSVRYTPGYKEKVEIIMYSIKMVESNGRYKAKSKWSSACGAYQYITLTWNNYKGFKNACLAPMWVQDRKMRGEVNYLWQKHRDWDKVIAGHMAPSLAGDKSKWHKRLGSSNPTIKEYVHKVKAEMKKITL